MSTTAENQRKLLVGAGIVIAILMGIIAILLFNKFGPEGSDKVIAEQKTEINEANLLNKELQDEYDNAIAELDEALAENEDLRTIIEEQKAELTKQKNKISRTIKSSSANEQALADARSQLSELRNQQSAFRYLKFHTFYFVYSEVCMNILLDELQFFLVYINSQQTKYIKIFFFHMWFIIFYNKYMFLLILIA